MSYRIASSALKLRSTPVSQLGKRFASGHGEYRHFPFNEKQAVTHPGKFAVKCAVFMGTGFFHPLHRYLVPMAPPGRSEEPLSMR
ncbi:hypothetical protein MSAN_00754600 [Mycena sanguinolenta]|uniref:Uncharacterized protein n=1 Tax=Mycena sanguinolenta TaxID=230812 RepID=A0A8H6Z6F1_9AGAR|nr:hypothetical protein MSAN_00754600 [Mycena sanguinolenta]